MHWRRKWQPTPVFLPGESQGQGSLVAAISGFAQSRTRLSDFTFAFHFHALEKEMAAHSSVPAWRVPGTGEPGGCHLWGRAESDTPERLSSMLSLPSFLKDVYLFITKLEFSFSLSILIYKFTAF